MRDVDRSWWAMALASLLAAAAVVVVPIWFLSQVLPIDQELGEAISGDLAIAAGAGVVSLTLAIVLTIMSVQARDRMRRRRAALRGNLIAIPPSRLVPNPAKAPDIAVEPLVLFWQTTMQGRVI